MTINKDQLVEYHPRNLNTRVILFNFLILVSSSLVYFVTWVIPGRILPVGWAELTLFFYMLQVVVLLILTMVSLFRRSRPDKPMYAAEYFLSAILVAMIGYFIILAILLLEFQQLIE